MAKDLFRMIMEAEGDLIEPFDGGTDAPPADVGADTTPEQSAPPDGMDEPPPMSDDTSLGLDSPDSSDGENGSDDDQTGDDSSDGDQTNDGNANDQKLSQKASAILNQRLYQQMIDRNKEIESVLDNLTKINAVLPYEIVKLNEKPVSRLRASLNKCQDYMINKFVDSEYGENVMFFQKVDALYTILMQCIDSNLKQNKDIDFDDVDSNDSGNK